MARQTRAVYLRGDTRAMVEGIATLASGENPDGTAFSIPSEGAATENHLGSVGGATVATSASFTRPSNTTAYAQYDIVAAQASGVTVIFLQFSGIARVANGSGYIVKARLETNRSTEAGSYRMFLYRKTAANLASPPTNLGDNDLFPMLFANRSDRIGYIDFATWVTGGSGSDSASCQVTDLRMSFGCDTLETSLYGLLTVNAAVTPASAQQFHAYLSAEQN